MGIFREGQGSHVPHSPGVTQCFLGIEAHNQPFRELLGATDFSGLSHAYGRATDAVDELSRLVGDPAEIRAAERYLLGTVLHQSTPWPVTATIVELLARSLNDPALSNALPTVFTFVAQVADAPSDVGMPLDEDFSHILLVDGIDQRAALVNTTRNGEPDGGDEDAIDVGMAWAFEEIFAHARSWWEHVDRWLAEHSAASDRDAPPPFAFGLAGYALARLATLCETSVRDATAARLSGLLSEGKGPASADRPVLVRALGNIVSPDAYLDDADRLTRIAAALSPRLAQDARALSLLAAELGSAAELDLLLDRPAYRAVLVNLPNMIARLTSASVPADDLVHAGIGCLRMTNQTGTGVFQTNRFLPLIFPKQVGDGERSRLSQAQCRYLGALLEEGDLFEQFTAAGMAETYRATGLPITRRGCAKLIRRSERAIRG